MKNISIKHLQGEEYQLSVDDKVLGKNLTHDEAIKFKSCLEVLFSSSPSILGDIIDLMKDQYDAVPFDEVEMPCPTCGKLSKRKDINPS